MPQQPPKVSQFWVTEITSNTSLSRYALVPRWDGVLPYGTRLFTSKYIKPKISTKTKKRNISIFNLINSKTTACKLLRKMQQLYYATQPYSRLSQAVLNISTPAAATMTLSGGVMAGWRWGGRVWAETERPALNCEHVSSALLLLISPLSLSIASMPAVMYSLTDLIWAERQVL